MRIETSLSINDHAELKKESKEVLGLSGYLSPPFGQSTKDYVEVHLLDTNDGFIEKFISEHTSFEDDKIILNIGQDLRDRDYDRGEFKVRYNFIRKVAGGEDIVLTKTVNGQPNIIHSGNPELTGVPMGQFFTDEQGNVFIGDGPPANMMDATPLDVREWKFKVDEISPSRTEVRIVPQLINNSNYIKEFRDLIQPKLYIPETAWDEYVNAYVDLNNAWNTIKDNPDDGLSKWWRPRLQFQDNVTKKSDFGKLHWNLYGKDEPNRNLPTQDGGGQISWTGPDSSRLEFNVRREVEDEGFKDTMKGSKITVEKAYVVGYQTQPDVSTNDEYEPELPLAPSYIEAYDLASAGFPNAVRYVVKEEESTLTFRGHDFTGYQPIPNLTTPGVRYHFDFGCGHTEVTDQPFANHTYDSPGIYNCVVTIMTPNYTLVVSDVYRNAGAPLDGPGIRGSILDGGFAPNPEVPTTESNNESQDETSDETPTFPTMTSAFDGKIIKWNGNNPNAEPAPFYSTGNSRASTGTRWYVQNGHTRAIQGGTEGVYSAIKKLLFIEEDDVIEVPLAIINDLRLGPNLDNTLMGEPMENDIRREITIDWRIPGNPDDFQTNRQAREEAATIPETYEVRISGTVTIENITESLEFPELIAFTQINSNTTTFETPQYEGVEAITMRFEEGQDVVLTFPSVVNIGNQSISLSRVDMDGGTTNSSARTATFNMNTDKEITIDYGIQP